MALTKRNGQADSSAYSRWARGIATVTLPSVGEWPHPSPWCRLRMPFKPGNLRPQERRRISSAQGTSVRLRAKDPEKRLILAIRLVMICAGTDTGGGPQAEKGATSDPLKSEDGKGCGGCEEPPTSPSRGTSDRNASGDQRPSEPRNLRHTKWRRILGRAEDPNLRPAEALDRGRAWGL